MAGFDGERLVQSVKQITSAPIFLPQHPASTSGLPVAFIEEAFELLRHGRSDALLQLIKSHLVFHRLPATAAGELVVGAEIVFPKGQAATVTD